MQFFSAIFLNHAKKCPWLNPNMQTKIQTFNELYVLIIKFANHICTTKQTNYIKTCQFLSYHVLSGHNRQKIVQLTLHNISFVDTLSGFIVNYLIHWVLGSCGFQYCGFQLYKFSKKSKNIWLILWLLSGAK